MPAVWREPLLAARRAVVETVTELIAPLCAETGLVLVDVEEVHQAGRTAIRVVLDKPGGVCLGDLEGIHRRLNVALDAADPVAASYALELSSPGLERVLKHDREYDLFRGREVEVWVRELLHGRQLFLGVLDGLREDEVVLLGPGGECWAIPRDVVVRCRLHAGGPPGGGGAGRDRARRRRRPPQR